jgi:hypothetical protein
MAKFPVLEVNPATVEALEAMGTKPKYWVRHVEAGESLFKEVRPGTGEDWAEKFAAEVAGLLTLPHAHYELASAGNTRGSLSPKFVPENATLIHGNELLQRFDPDYVEFDQSGLRAGYTVKRVFEALSAASVTLDPASSIPGVLLSSPDLMTGYLLLDALIGNTDRHHENWAAVEVVGAESHRYLAPTFDHASSLGRNEPDERMLLRLQTHDVQATVEAYARRAKTPFFSPNGIRLSPFEVFVCSAQLNLNAARHWLQQLSEVDDGSIAAILARMPEQRMSEIARAFVSRFVSYNRDRLLQLDLAEL